MKDFPYTKRGLLAHAWSYLLVNVAIAVVWLIFLPTVFYWPVITLVTWGIGLVSHWLAYRAAQHRRA